MQMMHKVSDRQWPASLQMMHKLQGNAVSDGLLRATVACWPPSWGAHSWTHHIESETDARAQQSSFVSPDTTSN